MVLWNQSACNRHMLKLTQGSSTLSLEMSILNHLGVWGRIIIQSSDTDVLVLMVHYSPKLESTEELWMYCGHTSQTVDKHHYIPIHSICARVTRHCVIFCHQLMQLQGVTVYHPFMSLERKSYKTYHLHKSWQQSKPQRPRLACHTGWFWNCWENDCSFIWTMKEKHN